MTRLSVQSTRLEGLLNRLGRSVVGQVRRSWRGASVSVLALLVGYYLGQNVTTLLLVHVPIGRPIVVLAMVLAIEAMVRLRSRVVGEEPAFGWVIADNLRLGITYSVVFEAFKLGT
jgi:hypothetical protein